MSANNGQLLQCPCGKKIYRKKSLIRSINYCSNLCSGNGKKLYKSLICDGCNLSFERHMPQFRLSKSGNYYCSQKCIRSGNVWSWKYKSCVQCDTTQRDHWAKGLCSKCYRKKHNQLPEVKKKKKEYLKKYFKTPYGRELLRRGKYIRKNRTKYTDIKIKDLLRLKKQTTHCIYCGIKMINDGTLPTGKTLDHIVPLGINGSHVKANVRYLCRNCNISRPKNGSDILYIIYRAQLVTLIDILYPQHFPR